jgi:hypothetical protein
MKAPYASAVAAPAIHPTRAIDRGVARPDGWIARMGARATPDATSVALVAVMDGAPARMNRLAATVYTP